MHPRLLLPRRTFLAGTAGAFLLAACSDDGEGGAPASSGRASQGRTLVAVFNAAGPLLVAGLPQRAPFTIGDLDGLPNPDAVPATATFRLLADDERTEVVGATQVEVHRDGVPVPYFPFRFEVDTPGTYYVESTIDGGTVTAAVSIVEPAEVAFPIVGAPMPRVETPTTDDARGVDPICTADQQCPLHATSLHELLEQGTPVVALVATPQFCHTAMCGPVLELLLEAADEHPALEMVHIEVYESGEAAQQGESDPAPAVRELGLDFEPVLFVVGADGTVREVLVSLMDRAELADALALIA